MKTDNLVNPEIMGVFSPLDTLGAAELMRLSRDSYFETLLSGETIARYGSNEPWTFFLVSGDVSMARPGRDDEVVVANTDRAKLPLNFIRPCQWTIRAISRVVIFRVSDDEVRKALGDAPPPDKIDDNIPLDEAALIEQLTTDIERDSKASKLKIPSLPDIALQVQAAVKDKGTDVAEVARIVMADPPLAGRLVQVANSPMYRGKSAITTCQMAVSRMGLQVTRDLVIGCSLQQLFESDSPLLKSFMRKAWQRSTRLAALCAVISRHGRGLDEDRAMLAGLVYSIGTLPVIHYAAKYPELVEDETMLRQVIEKLSCEVGVQVLRRWDFDLDVIDVVRDSHDWYRDEGPKPDYCDVVVLAQLYSFIDTPQMERYPAIDEVPAFTKFSLGRLGPKMTLRVLETAQADIDEIEKVLRG
ncbi:MAG: HDOD domain-containing protein [Gammaproteobacteria bacterium]|nr:HDOD domain-containing protein [Gammaproteobacteria bacterium]